MKSIKLKLIESLISWLINPTSYTIIKNTVESMMDSSKTGAEKRDAVMDIVKPILTNLSSYFINLALEVAVAVLKSQAEKSK